MAKKFDPKKRRKFPKAGLDQDFSRLLISLNQTDQNKKNPALYQTIALLIRNVDLGLNKAWRYIEDLEELVEAGSDSNESLDFVVLANGDIDNPTQPINNGGGSFIYIHYE
jgi:hypothetical protein